MKRTGFIGSFALSALLVSAAVALLAVGGAMLAFGGFPGPSIDDSTHSVFVAASTTARPAPELILDAPALEADASGSSAAAQAASRGLTSPAGEPGTLTPLAVAPPTTGAPSVPPLGSQAPPVAPPVPREDPDPPAPGPLPDVNVPILPERAGLGEATDAVASTTDQALGLTDGIGDLP